MKQFVRTHGVQCHRFTIEEGQTKMPWAVYEDLQGALGLLRSREGNDGHDRIRTVAHAGTEDGVSPGSTAIRHRSGMQEHAEAPAASRSFMSKHILIQTLLIGVAGNPPVCMASESISTPDNSVSELESLRRHRSTSRCVRSGTEMMREARTTSKNWASVGGNARGTGRRNGWILSSMRTLNTSLVSAELRNRG